MADAHDLIAALADIARPEDAPKVMRFFKGDDPATTAMGVQIGKVFPVAKRYTDLDLAQVETLLEDTRYEVRMAAVAILDFKARRKALPEAERKALYDLYLRRHDRINNWDLVDRAAPHVIGGYLLGRDRSVLDRLAISLNPQERRTAIVATYAFLRQGETADTFRIAGLLARDADPYVQKAIGSWTREAGKRDPEALIAFLRTHRGTLPRTTITAASKLLPHDIRQALRS